MKKPSRNKDGFSLAVRKRESIRDPRKQKAQSDTRKGFIFIAASIAVVVALFGYAATHQQAELDDNFCEIGKPLSGHQIFLIDATDEISHEYVDRLQNIILQKVNTLPIGFKLTLVRLSGDKTGTPELKTEFSKCNPGQGSQYGGINDSKKKMQARWKKYFDQPLTDALIELESLNEGDSSPIIESINKLTLRPDFGQNVGERSLVLISDLMQYTSDMSQYTPGYNFEEFAKLGEPYSNVPLDNVNVSIIYIKRNRLKALQTRAQKDFWESYFETNGAHISDFR